MKELGLFVLILMIVFSFCSCDGTYVTEPVQTEITTERKETVLMPNDLLKQFFDSQNDADKERLINAQNEKQNDSTFTFNGDWLYGLYYNKFIKCRSDYSERTVLDSNGACFNIQIENGFVYYVLHSQDDNKSGIYRMRLSGDGKEKLSDVFGKMQICDGKIYYSNNDPDNTDAGNHLYRMNFDGSMVEEIISKPIFHWFVFGDTILYQDDRDNASLHLMDFKGNDMKLNDHTSYWPICDGSFIWYVGEVDDVRTIRAITLHSLRELEPIEFSVSEGFLVGDDKKLYFVNGDDGDRIYRIDKLGTNLELITQDDKCTSIQFLGANIISYKRYQREENNKYVYTTYMCNRDGSNAYKFY